MSDGAKEEMDSPGQMLHWAHQGKGAGHKKPAEKVERCGIKKKQSWVWGRRGRNGRTRKAPDLPRGLLQKGTGTEETEK